MNLTREQTRAAAEDFTSGTLAGSNDFGKVLAGTLLPFLKAGAVLLEPRHL